MKLSPRPTLLLILAMFLLPVVLAWLSFSGIIGFGPAETDNEGRLVIPPQPLKWAEAVLLAPTADAGDLQGSWVVLYPLPAPCGETCLGRIRSMHQMHRATGRDAERLQLAVLASAAPDPGLERELRSIHPSLYLLYDPGPRFAAALQHASESAQQPSVYLVDPLGNIMMTYEADDSMNKLLRDLKKLFKWSRLDELR